MSTDKTLEVIALLRKQLIDLDESVTILKEESPSAEELSDVIVECNLLKRDISIVYDLLCDVMTNAMKTAQIIESSKGAEIELKFGYSRTGWKHRDLATEVATKIYQSCIDMDSGEVVGSPVDMMQKMLNYLQPSYWKVTEVSKLGINVDNFCKTEESKPSLIVRKGKAE